MSTVLAVSIGIVSVLYGGGHFALGRLVTKSLAGMPHDVLRVVTNFTDSLLWVLWPAFLVGCFVVVQNISISLVAVPFLMSSKDILEDAKGKTDGDTKKIKGGIDRIVEGRQTLLRVQAFVAIAFLGMLLLSYTVVHKWYKFLNTPAIWSGELSNLLGNSTIKEGLHRLNPETKTIIANLLTELK